MPVPEAERKEDFPQSKEKDADTGKGSRRRFLTIRRRESDVKTGRRTADAEQTGDDG